ncbi:DUF2092 domain-containing protein [Cryobacterium sp. CG_9.6]|uniref:LolA family protein n=1 Tax=Cryobacterium sp. CG_9.6 TaxID=2760710 RepID=UPI00247654D3|nr:DUF2092 domain-containing protein [Cryobacterium sp. CG_9.6]MDH6236971.1 outer membrane lipoprotein-sorting protein [Cryobacterium sp. CG_9.6]
MPNKSFKWLPAIVVPAVIVAGVIAVPLQAGAAVDLPDKTPKQVLLMVSDSRADSFSGTVEQSSNLGLPDIDLGARVTPSSAEAEGSTPDSSASVMNALELLTGSHTLRVYAGGAGNTRIQVLDRLDERNVITNGTDAWYYESDTNSATHVALPARTDVDSDRKAAALDELAAGGLSTPADVADRLLSTLDSSTTVSVGKDSRVAGRSVYDLVLTPTSTETLVQSISIAVDSETGLPLRVRVQAGAQDDPAFDVAFTSVDFSAPSADLFSFTPPANATVTEQTLPAATDANSDWSAAEADVPGREDAVITGSGWDAVVEVPAASVPSELTTSPLFTQFTSEVAGGRALSTSLVNVFITADGRVFTGAVSVERLQAVASAS